MNLSLASPRDEFEVIERYILLLLGVSDKPIPSLLHLEKELFILSNFNPKLKKFLSFFKHYYGPYSDNVRDLVKDPMYLKNAWVTGDKIEITPEGKKLFNEIVKSFENNINFKKLLAAMKLVREMYDKLTKEELLFLIYITYPEFREKSKVSKKLLSLENKRRLAGALLKKGVVTKKRYEEIVG